jgi:ribonuclease HII
MIISNFDQEIKFLSGGFDFVIGIDEAGRGPLAGPVIASATFIKNAKLIDSGNLDEKMLDLIRDSKTLSHRQREKIYDFILENFHVGIGLCDHRTIDRINILEASFLAMKKALAELRKLAPLEKNFILLLDGNKAIPNITASQKAIVNGDRWVKSISAASIVAKVTRDRLMMEMHEVYPQYGFDRHKGYGTSLHMKNLQKFGPCEIHRRSFAPVAELDRIRNRKKD